MIISRHYIFTPDNIWWGDDYIVTLHFHSWQYLVREWLYRDIIFSLLTIHGEGWLYRDIKFHSWGYLVRRWLYRDIIFAPLTIFGEGRDYIGTLYFHSWEYFVRVIISWHYIFTPDNIWWEVIISWHQVSLLRIFGEGVILSEHHIFTPDNNWWGGDCIVTLYFHSWEYLVRVIISWNCIFIPDTPLKSGTGGEYIWIFSLPKIYLHYPNLTLKWYQGFIIHIHVFTPWNFGVEMIIFKHDTLFAVET